MKRWIRTLALAAATSAATFAGTLAPLDAALAATGSADRLECQVIMVGSVPLSGRNEIGGYFESADGAPITHAPVTLRVTSYDGTVIERSAVTDDLGSVWVTAPILVRSRVQWFFAGDEEREPVTSDAVTYRVRPRVGIAVQDNTLRTGQRLVVTGRTFPVRPGHLVRLWAGSAPESAPTTAPYVEPVLLAQARVRADGSYRLVRTFARPGTRKVFVTVAPGNGTERGWTAQRIIRVRAS